ncbi:MAG TPA: cytidylate kinase family protein [Terriglobia bacterium]|nr:cytidylate kinase family protein [Terriglobia bacterium]
MAIITISRLTGSGGREIATATAKALNFQFIDRDGMDVVIDQQFPVRTEQLSRIKKDRRVYQEMVRSAIAEVAAAHNVVVLGSGAQFLFARVAASLHVQIVAPLPYRIARVMRLGNVDRPEAEKIIEERDREKETFIRTLYGKDWRDPSYYDLVLNIDYFSNEIAAEIIVKAAQAKGIEATAVELPARLREEILTTKLDVAQMADTEEDRASPVAAVAEKQPLEDRLPEFAHPSEREFARVMDFYRIRWEYEPRTFPIEWDENQNVVKAFTPDFYLPDLDLFIELTTMKQSLVTKKNRKVRLLRELYPEVNIKILYERDYKNLIWKYGLSNGEAENGNGDNAA